ncbi:MAG: leucine-rich repeat domain-containing protein [Alphaproteobacteria bacterium]|nr:leucine-rich repeat domain-containing protein [Alphaproteobacteria bacterium]
MKHLILAVALTFFATQTNAETAGIIGTWPCGADCTATLDDKGNFLVVGNGPMNDYGTTHASNGAPLLTTAPWAEHLREIKNIEINGVSNVGRDAFFYNEGGSLKLQSIKFDDTVETIKGGAFHKTECSYIELPDSIKKIESYAFSGRTEIVVPDTLNSITGDRPFGQYALTNLKIVCRGNNCLNVENLFKKYTRYFDGAWITEDLSNNVYLAGENQCNSAKYYWTGGLCNNRPTDGSAIECDEGWYATNKDVCARIKLRYTIPEADEATSNDNENTIEWIFE